MLLGFSSSLTLDLYTALVPLLRHRDLQRGCQPVLCRSRPLNNGTFSALLFTHPAAHWRYADWILAAWLCPETGIFVDCNPWSHINPDPPGMLSTVNTMAIKTLAVWSPFPSSYTTLFVAFYPLGFLFSSSSSFLLLQPFLFLLLNDQLYPAVHCNLINCFIDLSLDSL